MKRFCLCCVWLVIVVGGRAAEFTVSDILTAYANNADKLTTGIIHFEGYGEYQAKSGDNIVHVPKTLRKGEIRFDGERVSYRVVTWGNSLKANRVYAPGEKMSFHSTEFLPENEATYDSYTWDGREYHYYATPTALPGYTGRLEIARNNNVQARGSQMISASKESFLLGFMPNDGAVRLDRVIREAKTSSVRASAGDTSGTAYIVVDAVHPSGRYSFWFDPSRGFTVLRAEVAREAGDVVFGEPLRSGVHDKGTVEISRVERVEDAWVPMEGIQHSSREYDNGDYRKETNYQKRLRVQINPDLDKLQAFSRDDVKDGAFITFDDARNIRYRWEGGKAVPDLDDTFIARIAESVHEVKSGASPSPAVTLETDHKSTAAADSASEHAVSGNPGRSGLETRIPLEPRWPRVAIVCLVVVVCGLIGTRAYVARKAR